MKLRDLFASMMIVVLSAGPLLASTPASSPEPAEGTEVQVLFNELMAYLASQASQYSATIDAPQAKMFQLGSSPATIAPVESLSLADLGLLGLLEVGGPFTVAGTQLPAGSYRMELGGTLQQMLLYFRDSYGNRVVSIPVQFSSSATFQSLGSQPGPSASRTRIPITPLRVIGPNINVNFNLTRTPPFVQNLTTCVGFLIPFSAGAFTLRFCL